MSGTEVATARQGAQLAKSDAIKAATPAALRKVPTPKQRELRERIDPLWQWQYPKDRDARQFWLPNAIDEKWLDETQAMLDLYRRPATPEETVARMTRLREINYPDTKGLSGGLALLQAEDWVEAFDGEEVSIGLLNDACLDWIKRDEKFAPGPGQLLVFIRKMRSTTDTYVDLVQRARDWIRDLPTAAAQALASERRNVAYYQGMVEDAENWRVKEEAAQAIGNSVRYDRDVRLPSWLDYRGYAGTQETPGSTLLEKCENRKAQCEAAVAEAREALAQSERRLIKRIGEARARPIIKESETATPLPAWESPPFVAKGGAGIKPMVAVG